MTTQLSWASVRDERERMERRGGGLRGWRSHTFADGVRSLTLMGPLDVRLAVRLRTRVSELAALGCRRVILDLGATELTDEQALLLALAVAAPPQDCRAVVVAPPASRRASFPGWLVVAASLNDARRLLAPPAAG